MTTEPKTLTAEQIRAEAAGRNRTHQRRSAASAAVGLATSRRGPSAKAGTNSARNWKCCGRRDRAVPSIHTQAVAPTRHVIEAAILAHMGRESLAEKHLGPQAAQQARDLRATSLVDLCRAALQVDGRDAPSGREALIRAALSTYSLPVALGECGQQGASRRLHRVAGHVAGVRGDQVGQRLQGPHRHPAERDRRPGRRWRRAARLKHGSVKEATYKYSVDTFGKMLRSTGGTSSTTTWALFDDTATSLGRAAMRSLSDLVYKVLLANAGSFFGAGNGNYDAGAGTALAATSLATGIARMMAQRDDENRDLDIRPRTLLVPPELQQTAKELLQSDFIQRANNDVPTGNALKNVVTWKSNRDCPTRSGSPAPAPRRGTCSPARRTLRSSWRSCKASRRPTVEFFGFDADPNKLAATWRVYFDYGAALADHRAAYKAKGEA